MLQFNMAIAVSYERDVSYLANCEVKLSFQSVFCPFLFDICSPRRQKA